MRESGRRAGRTGARACGVMWRSASRCGRGGEGGSAYRSGNRIGANFGAYWRTIVDSDVTVCIMRTVKSAALIRELEVAGWRLNRVRGSHHLFRHPTRPGLVVVPHPKKDLGTRLVA